MGRLATKEGGFLFNRRLLVSCIPGDLGGPDAFAEIWRSGDLLALLTHDKFKISREKMKDEGRN